MKILMVKFVLVASMLMFCFLLSKLTEMVQIQDIRGIVGCIGACVVLVSAMVFSARKIIWYYSLTEIRVKG